MYILEPLCTFNVKITVDIKQKAPGMLDPKSINDGVKYYICIRLLSYSVASTDLRWKKSLTLTRQSWWFYFFCCKPVVLDQWRDVTQLTDIIDYILYQNNLNCSRKAISDFCVGMASAPAQQPTLTVEQTRGENSFSSINHSCKYVPCQTAFMFICTCENKVIQ